MPIQPGQDELHVAVGYLSELAEHRCGKTPALAPFCDVLYRGLAARIHASWYPSTPERGSARRAVVWDGFAGQMSAGLDETLLEACGKLLACERGVPEPLHAEAKALLPVSFTLWLDPGCVAAAVYAYDAVLEPTWVGQRVPVTVPVTGAPAGAPTSLWTAPRPVVETQTFTPDLSPVTSDLVAEAFSNEVRSATASLRMATGSEAGHSPVPSPALVQGSTPSWGAQSLQSPFTPSTASISLATQLQATPPATRPTPFPTASRVYDVPTAPVTSTTAQPPSSEPFSTHATENSPACQPASQSTRSDSSSRVVMPTITLAAEASPGAEAPTNTSTESHSTTHANGNVVVLGGGVKLGGSPGTTSQKKRSRTHTQSSGDSDSARYVARPSPAVVPAAAMAPMPAVSVPAMPTAAMAFRPTSPVSPVSPMSSASPITTSSPLLVPLGASASPPTLSTDQTHSPHLDVNLTSLGLSTRKK